MIDLSNPLVTLKITSAVCSFVAVVTTIHRLWVRRGRYWVDDGWAFFSFLCLLVQIASVFMHVENPKELSRTNRVAAYYLMAETFYGVIWGSRQAILFSIIRIDPNPRTRRLLYSISAIFGVITVFLMVQLFWVCEPQKGWKDKDSPQCTLNKQVAICQLVSDVIADLILLIAPIRLLRSLDDKVLRRKLTVIFSTCIITTIVSLVHAAYILEVAGIKVVISAIVEDSISLIVANVPVVVTQLIHIREDHMMKRRSRDAPSTFIRFATRVFTVKSSTATGKSTFLSSIFGKTTNARGDGTIWTTKKADEEHGDVTMTTNPSTSFGLNSTSLGTVDITKSRASIPEDTLAPLPPPPNAKEAREKDKQNGKKKTSFRVIGLTSRPGDEDLP